MSDDKLADAIHRGHRATALLDDQLLAEMFERYERNCIEAWKATDPLDTAGREAYWNAVVAVQKAHDGLRMVAAHGRVAKGDLERMNAAAAAQKEA